MSKLNWLLTVFSAVLLIGLSACCCCDDDDNPEPGCADLTINPITIEDLNVVCPGGAGTCVTTLTFTIENIGDADADTFEVGVVLDPGAAVMLTETIVGGLDAGDSVTVTVVSPPGGNCYDPDCSIDITVDSAQDIEECDESNNFLSETFIG